MRLLTAVRYPRRGKGSTARGASMDDRRVPNLEAMDEEEATRLLTQLASALSPEGEYQIRHPEDYVMEMPQSGERFRERENVKAFQAAFTENSTPPSIRIRRVLVRETLWIVESVVDYGGGQLSHGVAILELKDGKVWRDTRYFAELFERRGGGLIWSSGW